MVRSAFTLTRPTESRATPDCSASLAPNDDAATPAAQIMGVLLAGEHLTGGGSDLSFGEDPGCQLIEHRLKQVMGGLADQGHLDVHPAQRLGREEPAEAGADDDDAKRSRSRLVTLVVHPCLRDRAAVL